MPEIQLPASNIDSQQTSYAKVIVVTIDVHATKDLIFSGKIPYLDVRTVEEFKKGHVDVKDNIINIPYMFNTPEGRVKNPKFVEQVSSAIKKDDHLVVGCQSGVRSVYATIDLLKAEFKHVYNMGGGYIAWTNNNLGVKIPESEPKAEQEPLETKIAAHSTKIQKIECPLKN